MCGAPAARAQEALYLNWDDCTIAGSSDSNFGCGNNDQVVELFCAFTPGFATGADVIGIEAVVDVQHSLPTLPDWWRMAASGQCRSGALSASGDFTGLGACVDPWRGLAGGEIQAFDIGQPHGAPNQLRMLAVAGIPSDSARALSPGQRYYGVKIRILTINSTGTSACAGCGSPACLVLNGITVRRLPGAPGGDFTIVLPGAGDANRATWRGGAGADCALVPVRAVTWGRIKSLYR